MAEITSMGTNGGNREVVVLVSSEARQGGEGGTCEIKQKSL